MTGLLPPTTGQIRSGTEHESELLVACSRVHIGAVEADAIRKWASDPGLDWSRLILLAQQHCVLPLLYRSINACAADLIPDNHLANLRTHYQSGTRHNMLLTAEMLRIVDRLKSAAIQSIPFKGPILAQSVYGDISLRTFCDLDVLVRESDIKPASDILREMGYVGEHDLSPEEEAAYVRYEHAFQFIHKTTGTVVELHWRLSHKNLSFGIDSAGLWDRLQRVSFFGATLLALTPEDLLIYLSLHGAKHYWERLEWICSISRLIDVRNAIKWDIVMKRAADLGGTRIVRLALLLAATLLENRYAREVLDSYPADGVAAVLAGQVREQLFGTEMGHQARQAYRHTFYLQTRERLLDRIRGVVYTCIRTPHPLSKEVDLYHVPKSLSFLYYLLRPVRLAQDYGFTRLRSVLRPGNTV